MVKTSTDQTELERLRHLPENLCTCGTFGEPSTGYTWKAKALPGTSFRRQVTGFTSGGNYQTAPGFAEEDHHLDTRPFFNRTEGSGA